MQLEIYTAEVVYNGLGTAQSKAGILIQNSSRGSSQIMNVTSLEALDEIAADIEMEFPIKDKGFAISPAPVNAHIDLTSSGVDDAKIVLEKLEAYGVSVVGIMVDDVEVMTYLLNQPFLSGVIYWQVCAPDPYEIDTAFTQVIEHLRSFRVLESEILKVGLAFANIYSVSEALLVKLSKLCKQNKVPMQIAVSKTNAEQDLYKKGEGALLKEVLEHQADWQAPRLSPVQYLNKIEVLDSEPSLVYMNYADEEDIRLVQYAGCTVIHCPRYMYKEHENNTSRFPPRFPWEIYMKHGAEVAFATGVQGSENGDFDVRQDVQAALKSQQEKMSPLAAVRSAVKGGYRALKMKPPIINKGDSADKLYIW